MVNKSKMGAMATIHIIIGVHMNIAIIIKVKILMLIKWSHLLVTK